MNNKTPSFYIRHFKLVLTQVQGEERLEQSLKAARDRTFETTIQHCRAEIVAELMRRVQPLAIQGGGRAGRSGCDLDPMRHAQPGLDRMKQALIWVRGQRAMDRSLHVETSEKGRIAIRDQHDNTLKHPIGCLPEVIWHVQREFPADTAGLRWVHNRPQVGGGAA